MGSFNVVPGNIKQQMMPFVLDPNGALFQEKNGCDGVSGCDPQYFTFRNNTKYMWSGKGQLNFCPTSCKEHFNNDIANKLLFQYNQKENVGKPVTFNSLLDNIPGIQIREYIPDTALDQCINFFTDMIKEVMSLFGDDGINVDTKVDTKNKTKEQIKKEEAEAQNGVFKRLRNVTWFLMKYITGNTQPNNLIVDVLKNNKFNRVYSMNPNTDQKIIDFPYMLYYRLQSCTTTGIYEVPFINQDKLMYNSDGAPGWNTADSGWRFLPKSLQSLPGIGQLLGKMFGNIGISWMPWWDATTGNATPEQPVNVAFDLFNDTNEAALINFIFVNNLIPNNKWIQYGLFQHSSHIYDVKIEGYNRLFACTGKFSVKYDGVLRDPPPNWFEPDGPLAKHINKNIASAEDFLNKIKTNKLIKIPDIYKVTMTFDSLLPSNFNQYLYTLVANDNQIETYYTKGVYDKSQMVDALTNGVKGLINGAKYAFNNTTKDADYWNGSSKYEVKK